MAELMRYAQLVKGGKTIKQGEIFELAFQLFGSDNVITVPTVGQVIGIKIANMSGVVLETTGVVDGNKIKFTVSENIGSGKMRLEIKITEGTTLIQKYPAEGWIVLNITASLDDVGAGNVYAVTAQQMRDEITAIDAKSDSAISTANIAVVTADSADAKSTTTQAQLDTIIIASGTSDAETIQARGGEPLLYNRLDGIDVSLADKLTKEQENVNFALKKNIQTVTPLVTFEDDDGRIETYTKIFPLFQQKSAKFVSAVSSGLIGSSANYMTNTQIKEVFDAGHEIASHGVMHRWATLYPEENKQSYDQLNALGYKTENFVYVGGDFNASTILDMKKYYNSVTAVGGGMNFSPVRTFALNRAPLGSFFNATTSYYGISQDGSLASYKAMVDYAIANKGWLIFMMHSFNADHTAAQQQILSDLIDYIQTTSAKIVTRKEGLALFGNKVDIGDTVTNHFLIGTDGKVQSTDLDKRIYNIFKENATDITSATPYTYFPTGKVHMATIADNVASGFPVSNGGTLITNNLKDSYFVYQYWYPYNSYDKIYFRKWKTGTSSWDTFKTFEASPILTEIVSVPGTTINANSAHVFVVPTTQSASFDVNSNSIVGNPRGGIEGGLAWTVEMQTDKVVKLRLYNVTGAPIVMSTKTWHFKVIK